ncbi:MAG: hypothetical protein ACKOYM_01305, partial [Actinomycetes bacterium]
MSEAFVRRSRRHWLILAGGLLFTLCSHVNAAAVVGAGAVRTSIDLAERDGTPSTSATRYRPPVDALVVDPFRPPATRWGSGNRGLQYGARPGRAVRAIGDGVVF